MLACTARALQRIHREYFAELDEVLAGKNPESVPESSLPDVRDIMVKVRKQILVGCRIVFR